MNLSLSYSLGRSMVYTRGDADANAYIAAVEGAGVSVSATQRGAIDDFYVAAKADSYYTSLKRLYLPIWASAAANAIDMIGLTSGTFNGTVTHSAGYVQGDGSTGYFNLGIGGLSAGLTSASALLFSLTYEADPDTAAAWNIGAITGAPGLLLGKGFGTVASGRITNTGASLNGASNTETGILTISATSDSSRSLRRRISSGASSLDTSTGESAFTLLNTSLYALARNFGGINQATEAKLGSYGIGTGLDDTAADAFTLALKNLWETCTSLSLP